MKRQAGAIVLREAYEGYVPALGVQMSVRTCRNSHETETQDIRDLSEARSAYISSKLRLPMSRFMDRACCCGDALEQADHVVKSIKSLANKNNPWREW